MRALVTGGAGFLGSHLVDRLLEEGCEVLVLDNLITGNPQNLAHRIGDRRLTFRRQDVTEYLEVDGPLDLILHFASPASPDDFARYPIQVLKAGAMGTHRTLGVAKAKKARYLLASTSEVYGDPAISPQPETYWGNVNPIGPRGVYDEAKRYAEAMTMAYHRIHGVDTRIARFFNTFGPRMRLDDGRVVPNFIRQALTGAPLTVYGDGMQTRSFGYVDDIIDGVWRLMRSSFCEPVNIGNDEERTVLDFALQVLRVTGSRSAVEHVEAAQDDPRQRRPDLTRAREVLGWSPTTTLEAGLRRTVEWFQERL